MVTKLNPFQQAKKMILRDLVLFLKSKFGVGFHQAFYSMSEIKIPKTILAISATTCLIRAPMLLFEITFIGNGS